MASARHIPINAMNITSENLPSEDLDALPEVDAFSSSLAPVNRTERFLFGIKDRLCCVGLLAVFVALMRLFISR